MTTAFTVGLVLGFIGGMGLAGLIVTPRIERLRERLGFAQRTSEAMRQELLALKAQRGEIYVSEYDTELLGQMGIRR